MVNKMLFMLRDKKDKIPVTYPSAYFEEEIVATFKTRESAQTALENSCHFFETDPNYFEIVPLLEVVPNEEEKQDVNRPDQVNIE